MSLCRKILLILLCPALARAETLPDLVAEALANNPELRAARARVEATAARAQQARLWPNPELEWSAEEIPLHNGGFSHAKQFIGLSQTIPFPGKKGLDAQIGHGELAAAEWTYAVAQTDLVRRVKIAFYRALAAEKKLAVAGALVELAQTTVATAQRRVETGAAGNQERLRAEIELERAQVALAGARAESDAARLHLGRLVGRDAAIAQLEGELSAGVAGPPAPRAGYTPAVRAAQAGRDRAELELRRAKLDPWPDVTVTVAGGRDAAKDETLTELRVSVPLPVFDRAQARKREARALAEMARHETTATVQQQTEERIVLENRLRTASTEVAAYQERILPKVEESLRLARSGFEAGKFDFLGVLDTQRTAAETRLMYYDKLLELNITAAELEALAGDGAPGGRAAPQHTELQP